MINSYSQNNLDKYINLLKNEIKELIISFNNASESFSLGEIDNAISIIEKDIDMKIVEISHMIDWIYNSFQNITSISSSYERYVDRDGNRVKTWQNFMKACVNRLSRSISFINKKQFYKAKMQINDCRNIIIDFKEKWFQMNAPDDMDDFQKLEFMRRLDKSSLEEFKNRQKYYKEYSSEENKYKNPFDFINERRKSGEINQEAVSVENIHRIQKKSPKSGPELLEQQHLLRDNGFGENHPVYNQDTPEYETTNRTTQTLGPVEKKQMGKGDPKLDIYGPDLPGFEKGLGKKRKNNKIKFQNRNSKKLSYNYKKLSELGGTFFQKNSQVQQNQQSSPPPPSQPKSQPLMSDTVGTASNSFVNVVAVLGNNQSNGSGFWISKNHIVTAAHVVFLIPHENYSQVVHNVQVGVSINNQFYQSKIVHFDVKRDFAIIFVDTVRLGISENIIPINLGNSSNVRPGESILLIGNPLPNAISPPTTTQGIVSVGADVAGKGMFVVDAEALEGMSGGMAYSLERHAVVGIISGYFSNSSDQGGGATTLTVCMGIDAVKNIAKKKKVPFIYKESSNKNNIRIIFSTNYGSTIHDDTEYQKNESVGVTGGPGKSRKGKNPKKNSDMFVSQGPGSKSIDPMYMYHRSLNRESYMDIAPASSPFQNMDEDLKDVPRIKNRKHLFESRHGEWMFNIPVGHKNNGKDNIEVYKDGNDFYAYYDGHRIAESKQSEKNKKPLISLMKQVKQKYGFDKTYQNYIEDYGVGMIQ